MKILHLLGPVNLPKQPSTQAMSGLVTAVLEIARLQADQGHYVNVGVAGVNQWQSSWEKVNLLSCKWIPWANIEYKHQTFDFRKYLPFLFHSYVADYDIIHAHRNYYVRGLRCKKRIVHFHGDPFYRGSDFYDHPELTLRDFSRILSDSDAQIAVSKFVADQINIGFNNRGNVNIVHNGVNLSRFMNISNETTIEYRKKYLIPDNASVILYAGAITKEKGVIYLAQAFRNLVQKLANIFLLVVGESDLWGDSTIGDTQSEYSMSVKNILSNEIKNGKALFVGKKSYGEMPSFYKMSDIVVVPSIWQEGFGMVALDALAAGKPVIATRTGGMVDFLNDDNSLQVQPENAEELEHAMYILITNHTLYLRLAQQSRKDINSFRWEDTVEKIFEVYNQ